MIGQSSANSRHRPAESAAGTDVTYIGGPGINASPTPGVAGNGNVLTITAGAQIALNGTVLGGSSVVELYYTNHTAYQMNSSNAWFGPITASSTGSAVADPRPSTESGQGTFVTTVGPTLINATGQAFAITSGKQVSVNTVTDGTTGNVVGLLYWNHNVYQRVGVNNNSETVPYNYDYYDWYNKSLAANPWTGPVCDPRLPTPASFINITASPYNAVGNGSTDNQTAIQNAFNAAASSGQAVFIPAGTFNHSNILVMNGITVFGTGNASILNATTNAASMVEMTGTDAFLSNVFIQGPNAGRLSNYEASGIGPFQCTGFCIQNVVMNQIGCAGIYSAGTTYGIKQFTTVMNNLSDSITQINADNYMTVNGCRVYNSGDDGISNNSYNDSTVVHHVVITGNSIILNAFARGLEISGGDNITFKSNFVIQDIGYPGHTVLSESGGFNTLTVTNSRLFDSCIVNCGGAPGQTAILLGASTAGTNTITGLVLRNIEIINSTASPISMVGGGAIVGTVSNTLTYEPSTGDPFISDQTGNGGTSLVASGTTRNTYASWPGTFNVAPGGGAGSTFGGVPNIVSPNGMVINQASAKTGYKLYDAALNAYAINTSAQITFNGTIVSGTSNCVFLLYWSGSVYQMNTSKQWFGAVTSSSGGSPVTDPRTV